jgi:Rieske Fe-S protein
MDASASKSPTEPAQPGRRWFLQIVTAALGGLAALLVGIPVVGYFFGFLKAPSKWVTLGEVEDFPVEETRRVPFVNPIQQPWDGMVAKTEVFVRSLGEVDGEYRFLVFAVNCAHLGCPVSWFPQSGLFMCPCHGGVYYANGERASGPPPRGLYQCVWRVRAGKLEVQAPHYPTLQDTLKQQG